MAKPNNICNCYQNIEKQNIDFQILRFLIPWTHMFMYAQQFFFKCICIPRYNVFLRKSFQCEVDLVSGNPRVFSNSYYRVLSSALVTQIMRSFRSGRLANPLKPNLKRICAKGERVADERVKDCKSITSLMSPKMNSLQNILMLLSSTFREKDSLQSTMQ